MNQKTRYISICLAAIAIVIFIIFSRGENNSNKIQEDNISNNSDINAAIPITSSKKENEIIIGSDEETVIIESGEEIIVGE